jgi:hypothetical protein
VLYPVKNAKEHFSNGLLPPLLKMDANRHQFGVISGNYHEIR